MNERNVRAAYDIPGAAQALSCGRTTIYELIKAGKVKIIKIGSSTRIPAGEVERIAIEGAELPVRPPRDKKPAEA